MVHSTLRRYCVSNTDPVIGINVRNLAMWRCLYHRLIEYLFYPAWRHKGLGVGCYGSLTPPQTRDR